MNQSFYRLYTGFRNFLYGIPAVLRVYAFFMSEIPARRKRRQLQKNGTMYLQTITRALDESGIEAFCAFGTLLGIVRDNGFIPYDDDIDMGILYRADFSWSGLESAMKKAGLQKLFSYAYEGRVTEETYQFPDGMHVDFFLFEPDGEMMRALAYFKDHTRTYDNPRERSVYANVFSPIIGLKKITFQQSEVFIPENPKKHLEDVYGVTWKVPDPDYQEDKMTHLMPSLGEKIHAQT